MAERSAKGVPSLDDPAHVFPPDDGCEESPSCLRCPLAVCVLEVPAGAKQARLERRNAQVWAAHLQGAGIAELGRRFGLSRRSILRILAAARAAESEDSHA